MVSVASKFETGASKPKESVSILERPLEELFGWAVICGCSFLNLANVLVDKTDVGLDVQVLAKLGLIGLGGLYGAYGFITRPKVRKILFSFPMIWLMIIGLFYFIAIPFSISPQNSLVSTVSIAAVTLMTVMALDHLGLMKTMQAMFFGMAMFICFSWVFYIAFPSIGVLVEPVAGGQFLYRMSGIAHSNTLGQYGALTVIMSLILYFGYNQRHYAILGIGVLAFLALYFSFSRTSLMALMVSLPFAFRHLFIKKEYFNLYLLAAAVMLVAILIMGTTMDVGTVFWDKLESTLSKSEGSDDLTTATGRADIWAYAIRLLQDQPVTGYGAATQRFHLVEFSSYTHNLFLNIAFSGGVFAAISALLMILGRLRSLFHNRHPFVDAIIVFIVVNGLFENVIFSILAGLPTMLWVIALSWPLLQDDPAVKELNRSDTDTEDHPSSLLRLDADF